MTLNIKVFANTDKGRKYENNEDSVFAFVRPEELGTAMAFIVVADGIGGHSAGEVASDLAIETMRATLEHVLETDEQEATQPITLDEVDPEEDPFLEYLENKLIGAIQAANSTIFDYAESHPDNAGNLGSTVTCAIIWNKTAVVANVGDSRTYLLRDGELHRITTDHSYVAELVERGAVDESAYFTHPQRNVITRALGHQSDVEVDTYRQELEEGDRLLCCSDGLWEMITNPKELSALLGEDSSLEDISVNLIDAANNYGGKDNIGVSIAHLE